MERRCSGDAAEMERRSSGDQHLLSIGQVSLALPHLGRPLSPAPELQRGTHVTRHADGRARAHGEGAPVSEDEVTEQPLGEPVGTVPAAGRYNLAEMRCKP